MALMLSWELGLKQLGQFRAAYGHCRVPRKWSGNPRLAAWVEHQRSRFGELPITRLEWLVRFGFDFGGDRYWLSRFMELAAFRKQHGHCNVPARWPRNPQLGGWLSGQRARR